MEEDASGGEGNVSGGKKKIEVRLTKGRISKMKMRVWYKMVIKEKSVGGGCEKVLRLGWRRKRRKVTIQWVEGGRRMRAG